MEIPTSIGALIGLVGAPFLIMMVVQHLRLAVEGDPKTIPSKRDYSLVLRDLVGLGAAFLLRASGGLASVLEAGVADNIATVVLVGLALSFIAGQLFDRFPGLVGAAK